jgi:phosphatidyl-myo-inositol alpha-mannosyltransferase
MGGNRVDLGRAMKIALVSPYDFPYPGGVTEHIIALADGLREQGHEIHILAASSGYRNKSYPNIRPVSHHLTNFPIGGTVARVSLSPRSYVRIKRILKEENFDIIHLQEPLTPSITWWVLINTLALANIPVIGTFHAYHEQPNWFYHHGRPIFGRLFTRLDRLIAVSKAAQDFAYRMFPGHYQIIPNGIDLERFGKLKAEERDVDRKLNLLFVGRLDKRKGFLHLLEAFIKIKPAYPKLQLQVIGPFEAKACQPYQRLAQAQGVTDIEFVGYVSPERLPDFYRKADIFCAPSLGFESFGIVLLEAMAAGAPIVASDIAGYRCVITHGKEGILVPPAQPAALVQALRQLLDQPEQRYQMGQWGRLKAQQHSWELIVHQVLEVYQEALQDKVTYGGKQPYAVMTPAPVKG